MVSDAKPMFTRSMKATKYRSMMKGTMRNEILHQGPRLKLVRHPGLPRPCCVGAFSRFRQIQAGSGRSQYPLDYTIT